MAQPVVVGLLVFAPLKVEPVRHEARRIYYDDLRQSYSFECFCGARFHGYKNPIDAANACLQHPHARRDGWEEMG